MHNNAIVFTLFLIFCGAAILSTFALYTRQSMLVAYMFLGVLLGPWGLKLVVDSRLVEETGDIGIIFLLFLLGLHLQPQNLVQMFRRTTWVTIVSALIFTAIGYIVAYSFGYSLFESMVIGAAMMFSSTIIGLKLLPTTVLHHQHTGEVMISVLLMQDLLAIIVLVLLHGATFHQFSWVNLSLIVLALPALLIFAFVFTRFILLKLFIHFDRIREYMFMLSIAWCLGMAELASLMGLSFEVGAFIAGVSIAASPIALYIAESLKPVRDFFLVMFFFSVGASFNLGYVKVVVVPALLLGSLMLIIKPIVFKFLLSQVKETKHVAWEVGFRLGQTSEFSLLVAYLGLSSALLTASASYLIQATTILTFIVSSYIVVLRYPTPVAVSEKLRRD